jgi:hypothetical protein
MSASDCPLATPGSKKRKTVIVSPSPANGGKLRDVRGENSHQKKKSESVSVISIENYDRTRPCAFTEKATIEAMKKAGVEASELFMPSPAEMASYRNDPDIRRLVLGHHTDRINRLVNIVSWHREEVMRERKERSVISRDDTVERDFLKLEKRRLERAQEMQRKDAEQLIVRALSIEERDKENRLWAERDWKRKRKIQREREKQAEMARIIHLGRVKEMEYQDKRRQEEEAKRRREQALRDQRLLEIQQEKAEENVRLAQEAERKRQERSEQNRLHLEQMEEGRKARIREKEEIVQEREARRLRDQKKRWAELARKNEEERIKRDAQLESLRQFQLERIEKKRAEKEETEAIREKQAKKLKKRLRREQEEYAARQRVKVERNAALRELLEKEDEERKRKAAERQADMDRVGEEQRKRSLMRIIAAKLKQEERDANAKHLERQSELRKMELSAKQIEEEERLRLALEEKKRLQEQRLRSLSKVADERKLFEERFWESLKKASKAQADLKTIAKKFGMDLHALRARVGEKRSSSSMAQGETGRSDSGGLARSAK